MAAEPGVGLVAGPGFVLEVDGGLLALASSRVFSRSFEIPRSQSPRLRVVRRREESPLPTPMSSSVFEGGSYRLSDGLLEFVIPENPFAAEAALRIAWHAATLETGGLLLHASGVSFGGVAVVAPGQSGDGKSTLATLCVRHTSAQLLSDEIIQVFPDGMCAGTPFRSNCPIPGAPCQSRVGLLVKLAKGAEERLEPIAPTEAFTWLMQATYESEPGGLSPGEKARRVMQLLSVVMPRRLTFRNDPVVGTFLSERLDPRRV